MNAAFCLLVGIVLLTRFVPLQDELPAAGDDCQPHRDLLGTLTKQQLDAASDGFDDLDAKYQAARSAVDAYATALLDRHFPDEIISYFAQDYVSFCNATSPRLSGNIVRVGPQEKYADLIAAAPHINTGDMVLLGAGSYDLPPTATAWNDIALVGRGAESTTLSAGRSNAITAAQRLRIEGVRIECSDSPFIDLRVGGSFHLRNCLVTGYNSGAGGSNAVFTTGAITLIEECVFDGLPGRAARPGSGGGTAFDMRGRNWLHVRQTQFVNNEEILRAGFPCAFDGCRVINNIEARSSNIMPYSGGVIVMRDSPRLLSRGNAAHFVLATDDVAFVSAASGQPAQLDQRSVSLIDALKLDRRIPYWIGLLRHESEQVRTVAATHLAKLIGLDISATPLGEGVDDESLDENSAALKAELEYAHWMTWYDKHKSALHWDESAKCYRVQEQ